MRNRLTLIRRIDAFLNIPLLVLSFIWIFLIIVDLVSGLGPVLQNIFLAIWAVFVLDFVIEFLIAPEKRSYLRRNWITAVSLAFPAFRIIRVVPLLRAARLANAARAPHMIRVIGSAYRGARTLGRIFTRHGFSYVMGMTLVVIFTGAAGMYFFESKSTASGLPDYWTAVWWTAMIITTMGSQYWPQTVEGRILCLLLAVYAFSIFGYVTAFIASFLIARKDGAGKT